MDESGDFNPFSFEHSPLIIHLEEIKDQFHGDVLSQIMHVSPSPLSPRDLSEINASRELAEMMEMIAENDRLLKDLAVKIDNALGDMLDLLTGKEREAHEDEVQRINGDLKNALEKMAIGGSGGDVEAKAEE